MIQFSKYLFSFQIKLHLIIKKCINPFLWESHVTLFCFFFQVSPLPFLWLKRKGHVSQKFINLLSHWLLAKKEWYKAEISFYQLVPCGIILFKHGLYLWFLLICIHLVGLHLKFSSYYTLYLVFYFLNILQTLSTSYKLIFYSYFSNCEICVNMEEFLPSRHSF